MRSASIAGRRNGIGGIVRLSHHWRYIMYLRNRPLERDEVVIGGHQDVHPQCHFQILTLPAEVCPIDEECGFPRVNRALVEPLFWELESACKAALEDYKQNFIINGLMRKGIARGSFAALFMDGPVKKWTPRFPNNIAGYRDCKHCGRKFGYVVGHSRIRHCSNACMAAGKKTTRSQKRTKKRAWLRQFISRCAHCSNPIQAQRSSKQYCSDRCRIAAFRARKPKPDIDFQDLGLVP